MKLKRMELPEIQIVQKEMLNKKISLQLIATNNGLPLSKVRGLLLQKQSATQDKIDSIIRYVTEYE